MQYGWNQGDWESNTTTPRYIWGVKEKTDTKRSAGM